MKRRFFLFFFICWTATSFGQFGMPSFKEVVTGFFTKYSFNSQESYLRFQRKKDGWYVSEDRYDNPGNYFNTARFWSMHSGSFENLEYPNSNGDTSLISESVNRYLSQIDWNWEEYQYQRNIYYGYPGWSWDVINDYANQKDLNDSLIESIARAYSNYASGFVAEQFGDLFLNEDPDRTPLKPADNISHSRIDKFLYYESGALEAYSRLQVLNPDYNTKVGNISIKLANEYMFTWLELQMAGDVNKAMEFAKKARYPDSLIEQSRTYLNQVPMNSVLITSGDNDTYPLWYLQHIENHRPDVFVLNYSLIGFRKYLAWLDQSGKGHLFGVKKNMYAQENFDYFLFGNNAPDSVELDVKTFLLHLSKGYNPYDNDSMFYKGELLNKYYSKNICLSTLDKDRRGCFTIGHYLLMNDFILLDIINTVGQDRIFFTFNKVIIEPLLVPIGNIYKIGVPE